MDESHPYPDATPYLYSETKAEAERRVVAANGDGLETVVLRPRFVWGPGDTTILPAAVEMRSPPPSQSSMIEMNGCSPAIATIGLSASAV